MLDKTINIKRSPHFAFLTYNIEHSIVNNIFIACFPHFSMLMWSTDCGENGKRYWQDELPAHPQQHPVHLPHPHPVPGEAGGRERRQGGVRVSRYRPATTVHHVRRTEGPGRWTVQIVNLIDGLLCKWANYIFKNFKTLYIIAQWSDFDGLYIKIISRAPGFDPGDLIYLGHITTSTSKENLHF